MWTSSYYIKFESARVYLCVMFKHILQVLSGFVVYL